MNTQTQQIVNVPPEALLAAPNGNIRFGLKKSRVMTLAGQILALGRITTPLKVTVLPEPGPNGEKYKIREGHYRQAAAVQVNKDGAGILCPIIVEEEGAEENSVERLDLQLSENQDREDLSPMDKAVAIQKYLDAGLNKTEVREKFSTAKGRKGTEVAPMSNAMLNIYLSFLEFPKKIQAMIHEGVIPVAEGYKLSKYPKDKWDAIIAQCEADMEKVEQWEGKLETDFLAAERKHAETEAKAKQDAEALTNADKLAEQAKADLEERANKAAELHKQFMKTSDKEAKVKLQESFKAAEADAKSAEKAVKTAMEQADKLRKKVEANAQLAADRAAKLKQAQADANKKPLKGGSVDKAAAKVDAGGPVGLTAAEVRQVVKDLCLPGSFPKVAKIGFSLSRCFGGEITDQQLLSELAYITGERKEKPKTWKEQPKPVEEKAVGAGKSK